MKVKRLLYLGVLTMALIFVGCKEKKGSTVTTNDSEEEIDYNHKTHSSRTKILSPQEELAGFTVPEGFIVELVASEENGVVNPIHIAFDDAGKLWTQTAEMYPMDPVSDIAWHELLNLMNNPEEQEKNPNFKRVLDLYRGKTKGKDKILVLSGLYGDDEIKSNVWADGLAIPQSILPYKNGSYVAQGSELFFLEDTDNDGKADKRTPLLTGFGFTDTHTMTHTLVRGPGDWVHFSHGALNKGLVKSHFSDATMRMDYSKIGRFSLDAKKMENVTAGLQNIWGFKLRGNGQWYGTEANDLGYSVVPMEVGTGYPGIGNDRLRPYQPFMPELHKFRVGGTGISGLAFSDDVGEGFPEVWKDVAFLANPITSAINAVKIKRNKDGSVSAEHLPDFLTSKDDWFRPVNMEFGPDGALYIVDWYNKIVSHNELPTTHPDRDKSHGRIFRIRHKSQKLKKVTNFYEVKTKDLVTHLKEPTIWAKRAAWHQISDRPKSETVALADELTTLVLDKKQDEITRILAIWSLEGIGHYDKNTFNTLLSDSSDEIRRETIRSLQSFNITIKELASILTKIAADENAMIRSQVLRTLEAVGKANQASISILVNACKPPLPGNEMGGAYERNFERYLARKALERYPEALSKFIASSDSQKFDTSNLIWASQALPEKEREDVFVSLWKQTDNKTFDEPTFIIAAGMLDNPKVREAVLPQLKDVKKADYHVSMTLKNVSQVQSNELTSALVEPIKSLLQSGDKTKEHLGLDAVGKLNVSSLRKLVLPFINDDSSSETISLVLRALSKEPKKNISAFQKIAQINTLDLNLRAGAIQNIAKAEPDLAVERLVVWLPKLDDTEKEKVISVLSHNKEGSHVLKELLVQNKLTSNEFTISSAEKVFQANKEDSVGKQLFDEVKRRVEEEKKEFTDKLNRFMAIAEKGSGDPQKGEQLFQVCLMCHSVGDKGFDYAPALDGSSLRENEALLTAILNPDAAVESSYAIYRVTKKDGNSLEGFLVKQNDRGTTLGFMGGSNQFIQASEIESQGFLGGRSFMPKGLIDNYTDNQIADLLAFIKTLK
ncbi:PVC-type heme-binding CxxCH protein [Maribacter ulvicola]|uniref:Putative membrane-bound dehydrogenase domain-containing protein n=1 Tax=Maribacter ulvicola TaxID=228959 RepID=A0A1N6ZXC9_9FLAO|nr:PVC-type heme-binding CxxCH protein [Maribacter ulvicola]SIR31490.1 putative membrane-bound dehydrogenase domain-containing protein [Maribacter ulvicola]